MGELLHNGFNKLLSFCLIFFLLLNLTSCKTTEVSVQIFSNIEECKNIETLKSNDADVDIYDSPFEDKSLKDLKYKKFFGFNYISENLSFELFAYEFSSSDIAVEYFENVTGKQDISTPAFSDVSGMKEFRRIVIKDNKAYVVSTNNSDSEKVIEFLNGIFSVSIE